MSKKKKTSKGDSDPLPPMNYLLRKFLIRKKRKKRKNTIKRKVRSLQRVLTGRLVPVNHQPHKGRPGVKGMCSLSISILAVFSTIMLTTYMDIHSQNQISTLCSIAKDFLLIKEYLDIYQRTRNIKRLKTKVTVKIYVILSDTFTYFRASPDGCD